MVRYQTASLTVGMALLFVFSSFQVDNAHGFQTLGSNSSGWNFDPNDFGNPISLTWSIAPDNTPFPINSSSNLIAFLDGNFHGGPGPGGSDLTQRSWFNLFESSFERWDSLSGIDYQYEPNDDGEGLFSSAFPGAPGVRGDTRIGGDDLSGPLGFASPPTGNGDIGIATAGFAGFLLSSSSENYRQLRNTLMHEIAHSFGLGHVTTAGTTTGTFLLQQSAGTAFDGPQLDDILGIHRLYGDVNEKGLGNDTFATATPLGDLLPGAPIAIGTDGDSTSVAFTDVDFVSINGTSDENGNPTTIPPPDSDVYSFTITSSSLVSITLTPKGPSYLEGPEGGTEQLFDVSAQNDLRLELVGNGGTTGLATANINGLGESEEILNFQIDTPGEYFVRVTGGLREAVQLYQLDLTATAVPEPTSFALLAAAVLCLSCRKRFRLR